MSGVYIDGIDDFVESCNDVGWLKNEFDIPVLETGLFTTPSLLIMLI